MNRKQFRLLLLLGVVAGGAGLAAYRHNTASWQGSAVSEGETVLGKFDLNAVAHVAIRDRAASLSLARKEGVWVVENRGDYPADFKRVKELIQGLWELKPVQRVKAGPSQFARLDLIAPGATSSAAPGPAGGAASSPAHTGVLVELHAASSEAPLASLLLGKHFLKKSPQFPDDDGYPAGRYVVPVGKQGAAEGVSLVSETLDFAETKPAFWLKKDFVRMNRIRSVALGGPAASAWKLSRESDAATEWKLENAAPGETLDSAKVPSFPAILGSPSFEDVLPPNAPFQPEHTVMVETFDGFTYTLAFGKPQGENLPLRIALQATLAKERTPGKDEKPEAKKKRDDAFAAQHKQLEEKLQKEKTLEGRVYLVSKTAFEPLLKARADLLKKEKSAPAPAPSATPAPSPTAKK